MERGYSVGTKCTVGMDGTGVDDGVVGCAQGRTIACSALFSQQSTSKKCHGIGLGAAKAAGGHWVALVPKRRPLPPSSSDLLPTKPESSAVGEKKEASNAPRPAAARSSTH